MQGGSVAPEVILDHPEPLKQTYRDYMNAGTDSVLAFTYNENRERMRIIGCEHMLEELNRNAIRLAKEIAKEHPVEEVLDAGNISNTKLFNHKNEELKRNVCEMV